MLQTDHSPERKSLRVQRFHGRKVLCLPGDPGKGRVYWSARGRQKKPPVMEVGVTRLLKKLKKSGVRLRVHATRPGRILIAVMLSGTWPSHGLYGQRASVSDQLDRSWSEREKSLSGPEPVTNQDPRLRQKGNTEIRTNITPVKELEKLEIRLNAIESQIDRLYGEAKKQQEMLLSDSRLDNEVALEASLNRSDIAAIQTLKVSIDQHVIYETKDFSGLWLPAGKLLLFHGPIDPGKHRVNISARITMLNPDDLPTNQSIYRFIDKSFEIGIPGGKFRRKWTFTVFPPESINDPVRAEIVEADLSS